MAWELRSKILCVLLVVIVGGALASISLLVVTVVDPQRTFWGRKHDCDMVNSSATSTPATSTTLKTEEEARKQDCDIVTSSISSLFKTEKEALNEVGIDPNCGSHIYYPKGDINMAFKRWNCTYRVNDTSEIAPWTKYAPDPETRIKQRAKRQVYNFHLCPTEYHLMRPFLDDIFGNQNLYVVEVDWKWPRRYQWIEMGRCSDPLCTPQQCISEVRLHGVLVSTIRITSQNDLVAATRGELLRFQNYYVEGCCKCKKTYCDEI